MIDAGVIIKTFFYAILKVQIFRLDLEIAFQLERGGCYGIWSIKDELAIFVRIAIIVLVADKGLLGSP